MYSKHINKCLVEIDDDPYNVREEVADCNIFVQVLDSATYYTVIINDYGSEQGCQFNLDKRTIRNGTFDIVRFEINRAVDMFHFNIRLANHIKNCLINAIYNFEGLNNGILTQLYCLFVYCWFLSV